MAANRTSRSLSSRTRTVISPEIVSNRRSLSCGGLSRSAVSAPEMVFAASRWTAASAMVISPDTVSRLSSPAQPSASIGPETTLARIRPATPSRATRPLVQSTVSSPRVEETTTGPEVRVRWAAVSYGTATDTCTATLRMPSSHHRSGLSGPGQVFGDSCRISSRPSVSVTTTGSSLAVPTSTRGGPSVPTTLSRPPNSTTSSRVTGSSRTSFCGSGTLPEGKSRKEHETTRYDQYRGARRDRPPRHPREGTPPPPPRPPPPSARAPGAPPAGARDPHDADPGYVFAPHRSFVRGQPPASPPADPQRPQRVPRATPDHPGPPPVRQQRQYRRHHRRPEHHDEERDQPAHPDGEPDPGRLVTAQAVRAAARHRRPSRHTHVSLRGSGAGTAGPAGPCSAARGSPRSRSPGPARAPRRSRRPAAGTRAATAVRRPDRPAAPPVPTAGAAAPGTPVGTGA